MDAELRDYWRSYIATGEALDIARFCALSYRAGLLEEIERHSLEIAEPMRSGREITKMDVIPVWGGWDPDMNRLTTVVAVLQAFKGEEPPRAQFMFESHYDYNRYVADWQRYFEDNAGEIQLVRCDSTFNTGVETWEHDCALMDTLPIMGMEYVWANVRNNYGFFTRPSTLVIFSNVDHYRIDLNYAELGHMPTEQDVIYDNCEDYPACGHDICPPRWEGGGQAAVVCVCGALLPLNNRSSLCDSCLFPNRPRQASQEELDNMSEEEYEDYMDDLMFGEMDYDDYY